MVECPEMLWIITSMRWAGRALSCSLIAHPSCRPGPGPRCSVCCTIACESINCTTVVHVCPCRVSDHSMDYRNATTIACSFTLNTSNRPVPSSLRKTFLLCPLMHTMVAHTVPTSAQDPSVRHVNVPDPI